MKRNNDGKDRLMDALLREDAKGGADEGFLAELEKAIEEAPARDANAAGKRNRSLAPLAWAAVLTASAVGGWLALRPGGEDDLVAVEPPGSPIPAESERARLAQAIREQEDRVEAKRKLFDTIVKAVGIPYVEGDGEEGQLGHSEKDILRIAQNEVDAKRTEKQKLEIQLKTMIWLRDEELIEYAAGLQLPDNGVPKLYEEFVAGRNKLAALEADHGPDHPEVRAAKTSLGELERDLRKSVVVLQEILTTQFALADSQLQEMKEVVNERAYAAVDRALQSHDYVEAKQDYEAAKARLNQLKLEDGVARVRGDESGPLPAEIREQEDLTEEKRKLFHTIVKAVGIPYIEGARESGQMGRSEEEVLRVAQVGESLSNAKLASEPGVPRPEGELPATGPVAVNEEPGEGWGSRGDGAGGSDAFFGRGRDKSHEVRAKAKLQPEPSGGFPGRAPDHGGAPVDRERYGQLVDQPWNTPWSAPRSTFSVDVDTASYANVRRMLRDGEAIPKDAVRLEECVNYFDYAYPAPQNGGPFAVHVESATCPWETSHHLVKIGLKGKEVDTNTRPPSNLVFLIDVSGSMDEPNKLPLLVESMKVLVEELDERDSVGIVVYAGSAGTILEPTKVVGQRRTEILSALDHLRAGGSTAGAAGLRGAYELAAKHYQKGGVNRVILATDGDFNVGTSTDGALVDLVKEKAAGGVFLSVLGFGAGNLNDSMMEAITNDGNGNYYYIDSSREGRKVFLQNLSGTLVTIAKDVKIQVEFNPGKVAAYRLIGYANRILRDEDFNNDKVDAGDIGAGHTVTALYEIVPVGVEVPAIGGVDPLKYQKPAGREVANSPEWLTVKLRYKAPDGDKSTLLELPVKDDPVEWTQASPDFQFAAGVALFGEKLRGSDQIGAATWELVVDLAKRGSARDPHGHRAEFRELVDLAGRTAEREPEPAGQNGAVEAPPAR